MTVPNRCNLACPMCVRDKAAFVEGDMDFDLFKRLVDDNPGLDAIWPYGLGEPLMHRRIFDMIRYAKSKGVTVALSTNATLLNERLAQELLDSGLDFLILPFDGAQPATYEKYRYRARFEQVRANIEQFLRLKMERRASVHVTVQMILMRENLHEARDFVRMWRKPGVDSVRLREDLSKYPEVRLDDAPPRPRKHRPCFFLWRGPLFVQAGGTILPCPYYHGAEPFGNLSRQSAPEAWNSERMRQLRAAHKSGDLSEFPICARCPRYQPHPLIAAVSFFFSTAHIRRLLPLAEKVQRRLPWKFFE